VSAAEGNTAEANAAELHARASLLFLALRALPPEARASALAGEDERLAAEVRSLLAHDLADGPDSAPDVLPERIGPYRILARLGAGASGHVFLAEQEAPVRRRVALKVVPLAAFSPELAARFEVERAALEATDHPNIARVLDAGRTPDGLPYLVMNLVEGEPITVHCARHGLALAERVRLLLTVTEAVQHAHQRGVIHRDLKPANVLVGTADGRAVPQVLDFGIAKPVAGAFPVSSPPTLGLPMGTPAYMAPEQTRQGPVDTRADVYALGAMLYELVAGRPPIDVGGEALAALERVRTQVPSPASRVRATALAAGASVAASGAPSRAFLADLDVILGQALAKEPARRYPSVGALSDDLERLLACQPIAARAPSRGYRAALFVRRNRALVAAGALVGLALAAGVFGLWSGLREARLQTARAEDQFDAQVEINRFLTDDLLGGAAPDVGGPDLSARALLDRASAKIERRLTGRPLAAAAVHHALGEAYAQLAAFDEAEPHLARALELRTLAAGHQSPEAVISALAAASLDARRGRYAEAERALVPALANARLVLGPDRPELYAGMNDLGVALLGLERTAEALDVLREALAGRRRLLAPDDPKIVDTLNNTALALDAQGRGEESLAVQLEALAQARAAPDTPRMTRLGLENNVGATLQDLGRGAEAEPHLRAAAELALAMLGPEHPATLTIESNLGALQVELGELEPALATYRRVIAGQSAALGPAAQETLSARHGYCSALRRAGRSEEAADGFTQLLEEVAAALGSEHSLTAQTEISLAHALADAGHAEQALAHARAAAQRLTVLYGPDHARTLGARQLLERLTTER
jgi:tetratricopeptide (TPR) repeat protein